MRLPSGIMAPGCNKHWKNKPMRKFVSRLPWLLVIALCLTLGLAPFQPEPHLLEKLRMLYSGTLVEALDIFDLLLHAFPWALLLIKLGLQLSQKSAPQDSD